MGYLYNIKYQYKGGVTVKLVGKLKEEVENSKSKEEAKKVISEAGFELTDEEMEQVAGGLKHAIPATIMKPGRY